MSVIFFIISILYGVILIQQGLWGNESLISGVETFWFIVKILLVGLLLIPLISATERYKYNEPTDLQFTCTLNNQIPSGSATFNITISYLSDGTKLVNNQLATAQGQGSFNYTTTFTQLGTYEIQQFCYDSPYSYSNTEYIEVTPTGYERLGAGEGISLLGILALMIIVAITFLVIGMKTENPAAKITFCSMSVIFFIISILYGVILIQQGLWGNESLISGVETFWFIVKILLGIGVLALFIIVSLILIKSWKIKRGHIDLD